MNPVVQNGDKIKAAAKERGDPIPSILLNPPEIPDHLVWIYSAFGVLSNTRSWNYTGPNPIALTEVKAYCELKYLKELEDIDDLIYFLQELDSAWMKVVDERAKSKSKAKK